MSPPLSLHSEGRCPHLVLTNAERGNPLNRALIEALHAALGDPHTAAMLDTFVQGSLAPWPTPSN